MKKLQNQLKTISKSLANLSEKLDNLTKQMDTAKPSRAASTPKTTVASKAGKKDKKVAAKPSTVLDSVLEVVKKSRKGISITKLKEKTGLESRQLSNALYKLTKRGKVQTLERGLYTKK